MSNRQRQSLADFMFLTGIDINKLIGLNVRHHTCKLIECGYPNACDAYDKIGILVGTKYDSVEGKHVLIFIVDINGNKTLLYPENLSLDKDDK